MEHQNEKPNYYIDIDNKFAKIVYHNKEYIFDIKDFWN